MIYPWGPMNDEERKLLQERLGELQAVCCRALAPLFVVSHSLRTALDAYLLKLDEVRVAVVDDEVNEATE